MQLRARHNVAPIVCNVCAGQAQKSLPVDFPRTWDDAAILRWNCRLRSRQLLRIRAQNRRSNEPSIPSSQCRCFWRRVRDN